MKCSSSPQDVQASLATALRAKGYRLTRQRRAIISVLARDMTHPGARDILRQVRKKAPQISMSTVYYTLDLMKREGLLHEIAFSDRDNRYDINVSAHINLICRSCSTIEDFPVDRPVSSERVQEKTGFQPVGMRFEYYGYCRECRRKRGR